MAQLPMYAAAVNSPGTELAADITATDTEITVLDASKMPAAPNLVTVGGDETAETILYAGKTGNTLTGCTRGFEGTAKGWAAGSPAARNHTAYDYEAGRANIADLDERVGDVADSIEVSIGEVQTQIGDLVELQTADKDSLVDALNEVFQSGSEFKGDVADAITAKGVPTSASDSKETFVQNIGSIETSTVINGQTEEIISFTETIAANDPVYTSYLYSDDTSVSEYPSGSSRAIAWSADDLYMAVAHDTTPFLSIYKRSGKSFTKLPNPSTLPTGAGRGCAFSPDGTYLAVSFIVTPFIAIYKRTGDTFTKLPDPAVMPPNASWSVSWSNDSLYLAASHTASPFMTIYKRSGDTFTKLPDPAVLPPATVTGVEFSPDNTYLAASHSTSPFVTIYKRSGDTFTKLANPAVLPPGTGNSLAWNNDGTRLAIGSTVSPFIAIYARSGDEFTKIANPLSSPPAQVNGIDYSADGKYLAMTFPTSSPYMYIYNSSSDRYFRVADPAVIPTGNGISIKYSNNNSFMAVGFAAGNYLIVYSRLYGIYKSNNQLSELNTAHSAGYAAESGNVGEAKKVIILWR